MNIPALNPAAELYLNILKIEDSEKDKIRSCISRYTRSKSCSGTLKWMIYRIKNAIKSIFGKSDWQATKKIILAHNLEQAKVYLPTVYEPLELSALDKTLEKMARMDPIVEKNSNFKKAKKLQRQSSLLDMKIQENLQKVISTANQYYTKTFLLECLNAHQKNLEVTDALKERIQEFTKVN